MALPSRLFRREARRQSRAAQCGPQRKRLPCPPRLLGSPPGLPVLRPPRLPGSPPDLELEPLVFPALAPLPHSREEQPSKPCSTMPLRASFFLLLFSPEPR